MAKVRIPEIPKRPETGYSHQQPVLPVRSIGERARNGTTKRAVDADLFGLEQSDKRTNDRPEAAALLEVLKAVRTHRLVAWCERMNSGAAKVEGRFIRFGWPGCPDVLGQMKDGRLLGVEVKGRAGRLRPEQAVFLERIRGAGGVVFVARDLRDLLRELGTP